MSRNPFSNVPMFKKVDNPECKPSKSSPSGCIEKFVVKTGVVSGPVELENGASGPCSNEQGKVCDNFSLDSLVLVTPMSSKGVSIEVFEKCVQGICTCVYTLGNNVTQLKPCRFASLIFVDREPSKDEWAVFEAVIHGVDIVADEVASYECSNYNSILSTENRPKMDQIIKTELENGYLSFSDSKPKCVHALGAVDKPDGAYGLSQTVVGQRVGALIFMLMAFPCLSGTKV